MPNERCYFGCEAESFHTLLYIPPPFNRTPRLCAQHSKSWRAYKSSLKRDTRWPEDFWSWMEKELEIMKQQPAKKCYLGHDEKPVLNVDGRPGGDEVALCAPCAESWMLFTRGREETLKTERGLDIEFAAWVGSDQWCASTNGEPVPIPASMVVVDRWYNLPSGEVERACALRGTGRDTQAGFIHADGNPGDTDDIRWLHGSIEVIPASDRDVEEWKRGFTPKPEADVAGADLGPAHFNVLKAAAGEDPWSRPRAIAVPAASHHEAPQAILETPVEAPQETVEDESLAAPATSHKLSPLFSSESGEWQTAPDDFAWLNGWAQSRWGSGFVLDVCASPENALCGSYFTKELSCLEGNPPDWLAPWYMNPPYGDPEYPCKMPHERCKKKTCEKRGAHNDVYIPGIGDFVLTARRQAQAGRPGMCLLPFRPDTEWWRLGVLAPDGEQVAMGGDWAQGWSWVRWSSGLLVETRLISGRLSFVRPGGGESWTAPFPSVVVVFDRWK